jgi:hypothetical protein
VLAGSLHDHSVDSDGDTLAEDVARWVAGHREEVGLDFATLTDHSDFFPVSGGLFENPVNAMGLPPSGLPCDLSAGCGSLIPAHTDDPAYYQDLWKRQGEIMARYSSRQFSYLRGFEWTNDQQNHFNVLLSSNWTTRAVTGDAALSMAPFWQWFDAAPITDPTGHGLGWGGGDGIGMFNHPGDKGALNWDDYALDLEAAKRVALIEIHGDQDAGGRGSSDAGWYWFALAKGWTVSPVMNWDWHEWTKGNVLSNPTPGAGYGTNGYLPGQRSLILASDARAASIREALLARRTSASETPDLWATLRSRKTWQGSTVAANPGEKLTLTVDVGSRTEPLTRVDIVSDNGVDPRPYYEGDNASWTSPHSQLTPSFIVQHERYVASGGHATRKARIDSPPPGTVVASTPVSGSNASVEIEVVVPTTPSPRPDGKHFFYAIAYTVGTSAGPARCWTGPILTEPGSAHGPDQG